MPSTQFLLDFQQENPSVPLKNIETAIENFQTDTGFVIQDELQEFKKSSPLFYEQLLNGIQKNSALSERSSSEKNFPIEAAAPAPITKTKTTKKKLSTKTEATPSEVLPIISSPSKSIFFESSIRTETPVIPEPSVKEETKVEKSFSWFDEKEPKGSPFRIEKQLPKKEKEKNVFTESVVVNEKPQKDITPVTKNVFAEGFAVSLEKRPSVKKSWIIPSTSATTEKPAAATETQNIRKKNVFAESYLIPSEPDSSSVKEAPIKPSVKNEPLSEVKTQELLSKWRKLLDSNVSLEKDPILVAVIGEKNLYVFEDQGNGQYLDRLSMQKYTKKGNEFLKNGQPYLAVSSLLPDVLHEELKNPIKVLVV